MSTILGSIIMLFLVLIALIAVLASMAAPIVLIFVIIKFIDKANREEKLRKYSGRYPWGTDDEEEINETRE